MDVSPGVRVKVPLGRSQKPTSGYVVEVLSSTDYPGSLADIAELVSPVPVLTPELWQLARTVADRAAGSAADVLRLAIPQRSVRVESQWLDNPPQRGPLPESPGPAHDYSSEQWESLWEPNSRHALTFPSGVVPTSLGTSTTAAARTLALLAVEVLSQGKSVIVCVPDWRDSEMVQRSLHEYVDQDYLVVWSSEGTPSERYRSYLRTREEAPCIVVGSRHSVFAPVSHLGLIVVVSESDDSHREPLSPYPHTKDIALIRQQTSGTALVFADWVTSVDVVRLVDMGYLSSVVPSTRTRPHVVPTALTLTGSGDISPGRLPSLAYRSVSEAVATGPVLVQVFRSGFSPGIACSRCGERRRCPHCQGPLRAGASVQHSSCGWCGVVSVMPPCPECQSTTVKPIGHGVGRTVTELGKAFPRFPVIRSDGDHPIVDVEAKPALVVATRGSEPVAAGGYSAVLLLDGDMMLQRSSLGALEETLRGWEYASSLAAPGATVYLTDVAGPVVHAFTAGANLDLIRHELRERRELLLPPAVRIASVTGPSAVVAQVVQDMSDRFEGCQVLGPVRLDQDRVRSLLRFPYALGADLARALRAEVVSRALTKTSAAGRLRIVLDDLAALDQLSQEG
jgi:primosomal protein N' (replication factor Y) (superfamily II helicase)